LEKITSLLSPDYLWKYVCALSAPLRERHKVTMLALTSLARLRTATFLLLLCSWDVGVEAFHSREAWFGGWRLEVEVSTKCLLCVYEQL